MTAELCAFGPLLLVCSVAESISRVHVAGTVVALPFLISLAVYVAFSGKSTARLVEMALVGWVQDSLSLLPLGFSIGMFLILAMVAFRIRELLFLDQVVTQMATGFAAGVLFSAAAGLAYGIPSGLGLPWPSALLVMGGTGACAALTTPVVFWLGHRLQRWTGGQRTYRV